MEASVEKGEGVLTDDGPAPSPSSNPAADAAKAELATIMSDPASPHYAGFKKIPMDPKTDAHVQDLYKRAYGDTTPGEQESLSAGGPVDPRPGETPEEAEVRARNEVILAPLKAEWGADFDRRFAAACRTPTVLFEGEGMAEVFHDLGTIIRMNYGLKGEAAAVKFLAELEEIRQQGGRT